MQVLEQLLDRILFCTRPAQLRRKEFGNSIEIHSWLNKNTEKLTESMDKEAANKSKDLSSWKQNYKKLSKIPVRVRLECETTTLNVGQKTNIKL